MARNEAGRMKLTKAQRADLASIIYFMPPDSAPASSADIESFFGYSDKGIAPKETTPGHQALLQGKRWRGIHMEMWQEGIMDGSVPLYTLFVEEPQPESIVEFAKKTLFKGSLARQIDWVIKNG